MVKQAPALSLSRTLFQREDSHRERKTKRNTIRGTRKKKRKPLQDPSGALCPTNVKPTSGLHWRHSPKLARSGVYIGLAFTATLRAFEYCSPLKCFPSFAQTGTLAPDQ